MISYISINTVKLLTKHTFALVAHIAVILHSRANSTDCEVTQTVMGLTETVR